MPIIPDIRDFDGTKWRGRFLLTGGVPCQPASRAGKQRGKKDDRWLWPEAIRIVKEAKPSWCLFENPTGIYDVGIDGILSNLESIDYETGIVEIPACAVGSPHIRQRVWILAHADRSDDWWTDKAEQRQIGRITDSGNTQGDVANSQATARVGLQNGKESEPFTQNGRCNTNFWGTNVWLPCADGKIRRAPDDSFGVVDGLHRSVLAALGNSIVPQVAAEIIRAIKEVRIS